MLVAGIGQCSLDHLALVDAYPAPDTKKEALELVEQGGGPVATSLVALCRLGVPCRFHGVIGDDPAGEAIRGSLEAEQVDTSGLLARSGATSQRAFIVVEKGTGRRTIFWKRPSGAPLSPEELGEGFLEGCGFLLLDGLMKDASIHAAGKAREARVPVMLDAGRMREGMLEVAALSDYVVGSEEFASDMGWLEAGSVSPRKVLEGMKEHGLRFVTITLGRRGSVTFHDGRVLLVPAYEVEAVDTTGAGDVFHAGLIYGLLNKWDVEDALSFASAFAALKCRRMGGRAGIPTLQETIDLMKSTGKDTG